MFVMRRFVEVLAIVLAFSVGAAAAQTPASGVTALQLQTGFKRITGDKLVVNRNSTYAGHYKAFDLGVPTIARKAKYGTFTVYLVTGTDVETEVKELLADSHTGMLGTPGAGSIYWEYGSTIHGDFYWMAKRRYGANVVLWWIGSKPVKKTDLSWKRLHTALTKIAR
jgi:hypothetical protein